MPISCSDFFEQFIETKTWPPGWRNDNLPVLNVQVNRFTGAQIRVLRNGPRNAHCQTVAPFLDLCDHAVDLLMYLP